MANQTSSKSSFSNTWIDITTTSVLTAQISPFFMSHGVESFARNNILMLYSS